MGPFLAWFKPPGARLTLSAGFGRASLATPLVCRRLYGRTADGSAPPKCDPSLNQARPLYLNELRKRAKIDSRDVIVGAEYDRLDNQLHDFSKPFDEARIEPM